VLVGATVALTAVDLIAVALMGTLSSTGDGPVPVPVALMVPGIGALAALAVAVRRTQLVAGLMVLSTTCLLVTSISWVDGGDALPSLAALFALAVLSARALRLESSGTAIAVTLLAGAAVAAETLRLPGTGDMLVLVLCEAAFAVAIGVGIYLRWADWRRLAAENAARTDERLEIARELHDMVGHYVTGMVVQAQAARHVAEHRPEAAAAALERIEAAGADAMVAMRRMVVGLRDDVPTSPGGTWEDLDSLLSTAIDRGAPVHAEIEPDVRHRATQLAPSVHRIVAESLTNVRRHGRDVTRIDVSVADRGDLLVVSVHDDGLPAAPSGPDTYGIVGMRERAESLGGTLFAGPAPSGGWLVRAELPVERAA
jgi:signal transduction histidine kinase